MGKVLSSGYVVPGKPAPVVVAAQSRPGEGHFGFLVTFRESRIHLCDDIICIHLLCRLHNDMPHNARRRLNRRGTGTWWGYILSCALIFISDIVVGDWHFRGS